MNSKKELKGLVEKLKGLLNMTQEELSVAAGYQPKSLTQALSKATGHEAVIAKLKLVFASRLNNTTFKVDEFQPMTLHEPNEAYRALKERDEIQAKYIALLEKRESEISLNLIAEKIAITHAVLEAMYTALVKDAEQDKILIERLRKSLKMGN